MAVLSTGDLEALELARWLAEIEGTSLLAADWTCLAEIAYQDPAAVYRRILAIAEKAAEEPSVDKRPADEIIGYDGSGLPE